MRAAAALLLLWCGAAAAAVTGAAAQQQQSAVEAAAARGESVVLAAPSDEVGASFFVPSPPPPTPPTRLTADASFLVGAAVSAADLAALVAGNVSAVAIAANKAYVKLSWSADYSVGTSSGSASARTLQGANVPELGVNLSNPNAKLLGVGGNVLKPGHAVSYLGRVFLDFGSAVRQSFGTTRVVPPVQPVDFNATRCAYTISALDDAGQVTCNVVFDGRPAQDIEFKSALPPPVDLPLVSGGPLADFSLAPSNAVKLSCVLDDPTKFTTTGAGCAQIFPFPQAPAAGSSGGESAVDALLRSPAYPKEDLSADDALERWRQQLPPALRAPLGEASRTVPNVFFGGGGGGGGLPNNVTTRDTWQGSIGLAFQLADLQAMLNGNASAATPLGPPPANINAIFAAGQDFIFGPYVSVFAVVGANLPGTAVATKAKLFGVPYQHPLSPSQVVSFAGLVAPVVGRFNDQSSDTNPALSGAFPARFTPGQFCRYVVVGVNDAGSEECSIQYFGLTESAPTFPTVLANGVANVPLAPTAFSNFVLRPTSLTSFVCRLDDPTTPNFNNCKA